MSIRGFPFFLPVFLSAKSNQRVQRPQTFLVGLRHQEFYVPITLGKEVVPGFLDRKESLPGAHQFHSIRREADFLTAACQIKAFWQFPLTHQIDDQPAPHITS
jgi:hypothetical protein